MPNARTPHPGKTLRERFLDPLGITPYRLAKSIGVHVRRVSELVNGRRRITPDTAVRLGMFFDVPAVWWLEMQARYDAEHVEGVEELRGLVAPYEGLARVLVTPSGVRVLGDAGEPAPRTTLVPVPDDLLARLRAQAAQAPRREPRRVRTVTYPSGATALAGADG